MEEECKMYKFKIGDKVKIINTFYSGHINYEGEVVNVESVSTDPIRVKSRFSYGMAELGYTANQLELIEAAPNNLLRVSDVVELLIEDNTKKFTSRYHASDYDDGVAYITMVDEEVVWMGDGHDGETIRFAHNDRIWYEYINTPKKYTLKDKFFGDYLNLNTSDNNFFLSSPVERHKYKTEFIDVEIEELEIPIERFEKIEVK